MGQDNVVNILMMLQTGRPRKYGSVTGNLQGILIMNNFNTASESSSDFSNHVLMKSMIFSEALADWAVMSCDVAC
jgi:hypothetical protein